MTTSVTLSGVGTEILRIVQGGPDWFMKISSVDFVNVGSFPEHIFKSFNGRVSSLCIRSVFVRFYKNCRQGGSPMFVLERGDPGILHEYND